MGNSGLDAEEIASLNARARVVGNRLGWELRFEAAENPAFAGLTAGVNHVFVLGPWPVAELTVDDVVAVLDALVLGTRRILDEHVPRMV